MTMTTNDFANSVIELRDAGGCCTLRNIALQLNLSINTTRCMLAEAVAQDLLEWERQPLPQGGYGERHYTPGEQADCNHPERS